MNEIIRNKTGDLKLQALGEKRSSEAGLFMGQFISRIWI